MAEKSHPQGGTRTAGRHVGELGAAGALALLIVSFVPEGWMDAFQMNLSGVVLTGAFSTAAKLLNESGGLLKILGRGGLVVLLVGSLSGCAFNVGSVSPQVHTGADGETIVACHMKGVQFGVFDGGVCRNVEGGQIGQTAVDFVSGIVGAAIRALGGLFSGFGALGAGMAATPPPPSVAAPGPPAAVYPSDRAPVDAGPAPPNWFEDSASLRGGDGDGA